MGHLVALVVFAMSMKNQPPAQASRLLEQPSEPHSLVRHGLHLEQVAFRHSSRSAAGHLTTRDADFDCLGLTDAPLP
jgi:hypothetical protein